MDFLDFNLAEKLKEKGFPQHWSDQHYILENEYEDDFFEVGAKYPVEVIYDYIPTIAAPTISQVLKWLREEKKIYLELVIVVDTDYMCDIYKIDARPIECLGSTAYFKTYEQAAIAGIEYTLDNLI